MKQTANLNEDMLVKPRRPRPQAQAGAVVVSRVSSMPIEPPHPDEVAERLQFRTAAQYQKAVALAERYYVQAKLAVERRAASIKKAERQAQVDHEETVTNYQRQVVQAKLRHRQVLEQVHGKHRQTMYEARVTANRTEEAYKETLKRLPGYGELVLKTLAFSDARNVTLALVQAYRGVLGPDALGDMNAFLWSMDKMIDLARDRVSVVPLQFADALIKAVLHRQVRRFAHDKAEVDRLKQLAGARVTIIQSFLAENRKDQTPPEIREVYLAVHDWLSKAAGTPFDLALDRLKLDVEATCRREQRQLADLIETAAHQNNRLPEIKPVAEAFQASQRVLRSTENAAKNVVATEMARIQAQFDKEMQMADAMVIGMDHTAAKRLAEVKRMYGEARRMVGRWGKVLDELEEVGGLQKLLWRLTEGFDYQAFWDEFRLKQRTRP